MDFLKFLSNIIDFSNGKLFFSMKHLILEKCSFIDNR